MTKPPSTRREAGFSLAEALAVLAILGIALAVSIPAMSQFMRSYSARVGFDELTSNLRLARHLAIARHTDVSVVVSGDAYTLPDWGAPNPVTAPPRTVRLPRRLRRRERHRHGDLPLRRHGFDRRRDHPARG